MESKGGWGSGKGSSFHDNWWERAREISPSIPAGIHDYDLPDPHRTCLDTKEADQRRLLKGKDK